MLKSILIALCMLGLASPDAALAITKDESAQRLAVGVDADPELLKSLTEELAARGDGYRPRTEHLRKDGSPVYINRLIREDSPYLLQHAHNPVNWYPWGEEAFAAARRSDKPIFLSIGYATCHWCHVMERESFEDEAIAQLINERFIAIKVDREQRPDVDATFMQAVVLISGHGGWPMSSFLTADGKPFFGGTYFPPEQFSSLLKRISVLWETERTGLLQQAERVSAAVASNTQIQGEAREVGEREFSRAVELALQNYDDIQGGFGPAPKFPQESLLYLLLENARRNQHAPSLEAAHFSLLQMARGGIHDQVGGGFHRYAVDYEWLVPHFEKMLYTQAALARNYLAAYQLTGDARHARTARRILDYVLREMTAPGGGFYSATDADSEGKEGTVFLWTPAELEAVLGKQNAALAASVWGVSEDGNFEGSNILHLPESIADIAAQHQLTAGELQASIDRFSEQLLAVRNQREQPLRDDKILTEWNGMMITALAEASQVLDEPAYFQAARRAAQWLWQNHRRAPGQFWRAHFEGRSTIEATQADYAYLAEALLALYDISADSIWLDRARELTDAMIEQFWDPKDGGFFMGAEKVGGAALLTRPKALHDGATPSGNGVAMRVLARLWHRTGEDVYQQRANQLLAAFSGLMAEQTDAYAYLLIGASELLWGESGSLQYGARSKVRAHTAISAAGELEVTLTIAPGWHINAHRPLQPYLIGTQLTTADAGSLKAVVYPEPSTRQLGFSREPLALYEGTITISAALPAPRPEALPIQLRLQACSDEVCLAPETLKLHPAIAVAR